MAISSGGQALPEECFVSGVFLWNIICALRLLCLFGPIARLCALRLPGRIKAGAEIPCALRLPMLNKSMVMPCAPQLARPVKPEAMFCALRLLGKIEPTEIDCAPRL